MGYVREALRDPAMRPRALRGPLLIGVGIAFGIAFIMQQFWPLRTVGLVAPIVGVVYALAFLPRAARFAVTGERRSSGSDTVLIWGALIATFLLIWALVPR